MQEFTRKICSNLEIKKVTYGDARIVENESEIIVFKNGVIEAIIHNSDTGFGVRVLKDSAWGFSSSNIISKKMADKVTRDALHIARASASIPGNLVKLAPAKPATGKYKTKIEVNPFKVSVDKKIDLLMSCDKILAQEKKIKVRTGFIRFNRRLVHFASTEGSNLTQEFFYAGGIIRVYAMNGGEVQSRSYGNFRQAGYEFIDVLNLKENSARIRDDAVRLLNAEHCPEMITTIVLDAEQMVLQVHESCGHPTELDRVLGTEASYAGTSFMTTEKLNKLQYGSTLINIVADATTPGGLGTFGWDDEGIPAQRIHLIKNGIFTGYQSSRETAPVVKGQSSGAMRADGWNRIPLIRMTNINLLSGKHTLEQLISEIDDGVFLTTNKSWSIDDKRLNFQFACELAQRIEKGRLTKLYKNPTYSSITPVFWNNCDGLGNDSTRELFGVPNCGKGEPGQTAFVGHSTVPARFRNVQIGIAK